MTTTKKRTEMSPEVRTVCKGQNTQGDCTWSRDYTVAVGLSPALIGSAAHSLVYCLPHQLELMMLCPSVRKYHLYVHTEVLVTWLWLSHGYSCFLHKNGKREQCSMKAEVLVVELQSMGNLMRGDISRKSFLYSSSRYHIYSLFDVSNEILKENLTAQLLRIKKYMTKVKERWLVINK